VLRLKSNSAPQIKAMDKTRCAKHAPWWQVYGFCLIFIAVLFLVAGLPLARIGHHLLDIILMVAFFWWLAGWIRDNAGAIQEEYDEKYPPWERN
jgi:hypothetical protein